MALVPHVLTGKPGRYVLRNGLVVQVPESGKAIVWEKRIAAALVRMGMELQTGEKPVEETRELTFKEETIVESEAEEEEDEEDLAPVVDTDSVIRALDDTPTGGLVLTTDTLSGVSKTSRRGK